MKTLKIALALFALALTVGVATLPVKAWADTTSPGEGETDPCSADVSDPEIPAP